MNKGNFSFIIHIKLSFVTYLYRIENYDPLLMFATCFPMYDDILSRARPGLKLNDITRSLPPEFFLAPGQIASKRSQVSAISVFPSNWNWIEHQTDIAIRFNGIAFSCRIFAGSSVILIKNWSSNYPGRKHMFTKWSKLVILYIIHFTSKHI